MRKHEPNLLVEELKVKDSKVVKSNKIIEASYKLNLNEQKFILLMCSKIRQEDKDFEYYELPVKEISKSLGIESNKDVYREVKDIVTGLNKKTMIVPEKDGPLILTWVASAKYFNKQGKISFEFSKRLKPYLLQLHREFVMYGLRNVMKLRSAFSIRVYELLKQYEKIGKRTLSIEKLKEVLGLKKDEYKLYGDFKRYVLNVAKEELNDKTDISFEFNEKKTGRKVTDIEFIIYTQVRMSDKKEEEPEEEYDGLFKRVEEEPDVINDLIKEGVSKDEAKKIWDKKFDYIDEGVRKQVKELNMRFGLYLQEKVGLLGVAKRKATIKNTGAWLRNAIKFNWIDPKLVEEKKIDEKRKRKDDIEKKRIEFERKKEEIENEAYEKLNKIYDDYIKKNKNALKMAFEVVKKKDAYTYDKFYKSNKSIYENYKSLMFEYMIQAEFDKKLPEAVKIKSAMDKEVRKIDVEIDRLEIERQGVV